MKKVIFYLSLAGVLFAGYLSSVKFFSKSCAFGESCPYFLGYPACYYGLVMFLLITAMPILWHFKKIKEKTADISVLVVSFLGILFAGYFTLQEIPILFSKGLSAYLLGLPTCAMGLIFYIAIFIIEVATFLKNDTKKIN